MDLHEFSSKVVGTSTAISASERALLRTIFADASSADIFEEAKKAVPSAASCDVNRPVAHAVPDISKVAPDDLRGRIAEAVAKLSVPERSFLRTVLANDPDCLKNPGRNVPSQADTAKKLAASVLVSACSSATSYDDEEVDLREFTDQVARATQSLDESEKAFLRQIFAGASVDLHARPSPAPAACDGRQRGRLGSGAADVREFTQRLAAAVRTLGVSEKALLRTLLADLPASPAR